MRIQTQVAVYSVFVVFCFVIFSLFFDSANNKPEIKNGMVIIHAGVESKEKF